MPDAWLLWLTKTYEREGPLPRNEVADLAKGEMNAAAEEGLRLVLDDLERLHGTPPDIWLVDDDAIRVVSRGGAVPPEGITTPSHTDATVAVAEAVLDLLADQPAEGQLVCETHNSRLGPRIIEGRAAWSCESHHHTVSEIGQLPATAR